MDVRSTRYSKYNQNYHLVWIPKYRHPVLAGEVATHLSDILHTIAEKKDVEILSIEIMPDHIHLFVSSSPQNAPSLLVNWFKGIEPKTAIGVDVGLKSLVALSGGETVEYPRYYVMAEKKLAAAQRNLSRKKKGSANRRKAKAKVAKISQDVQHHRDEFLHQLSKMLVDSADLIVFENLNIFGMLKNHHLAKHIQDHAWGKLIQFTQSKAAKAGKVVELVDARYTSQKCSQCGIMVPKTLAERVHICPNCGLEMDRDINASLNIRTLGLRGRAYRDTAKESAGQ